MWTASSSNRFTHGWHRGSCLNGLRTVRASWETNLTKQSARNYHFRHSWNPNAHRSKAWYARSILCEAHGHSKKNICKKEIVKMGFFGKLFDTQQQPQQEEE